MEFCHETRYESRVGCWWGGVFSVYRRGTRGKGAVGAPSSTGKWLIHDEKFQLEPRS